MVEPFQNEFPDSFLILGFLNKLWHQWQLNGIRGFKVFIYSIANFPTFRCAEQIRNDICYHNLNVTVVSVGGGLAWKFRVFTSCNPRLWSYEIIS